jgi:cytochrome c oxidase accessory protein FixG
MSDASTDNVVDRLDVEPVNKKANRSLYAARVKIFPKRAEGYFRRLKWWIMAATLVIYYVTPWLRWDRGAYAPDQAVLVDIANRRFYFFFIGIWPQEFFYVAGLLVMAGVGLFLVTSTVGRAWCGYTCPQTVWVDLFIAVERWIEGDRNARIRLDKGSWTFEKVRKRLTVHVLWLLIAVATGGAWILYFADAPTLLRDLFTLQAAPVAYITVAVLTFTTYVFAGFMREQVCTYMCPWPRIQAAMLDEHSLTVTYNDWRGEPRSRHQKKAQNEGLAIGDCVDCNACVAVCPMGIDIRDGQQLECITCALCIDACDGVMEKVGKPRGLIDYATLNDFQSNVQGVPAKTGLASFIRPRTFVYLALWSGIGLAMLVTLLTRDRLDLNVLHDRNPIFVQLTDGAIRNGYTIKILNMKPEPRVFRLTLDGLSGAQMTLSGSTAAPAAELHFDVAPDQTMSAKIFVRAEPDKLAGKRSEFTFRLEEASGAESDQVGSIFEAPER